MKVGAGVVVAILLAPLTPCASAAALSPAEIGSELDLAGYTETFSEDFDKLDVSAWGPGSRWIAHTPWRGDFGGAAFADPEPGFPFTVDKGNLKIEARRNEKGKWRGGLLASVDPDGKGFSQRYGYFEMRAKLPVGEGLWPAFWLIGLDRTTHTSEIDVMEQHGSTPEKFSSAVHVWDRRDSKKSRNVNTVLPVRYGKLSDDFNTFGVRVDEDWIIFYFNRREYWRRPTPAEHKQPMYLLVNLGADPPPAKIGAPSPSVMEVDYIRAWRLPEPGGRS